MEYAICEFPGIFPDLKELQVDGPPTTVGMAKLDDSRPNQRVDTEFFVQLSFQCLLRAFTGLDLATGKLPFESHWLVRAPLADKNFVPTKNKRSNHQANLLVADRILGMCSVALHLSILDATLREADSVCHDSASVASNRFGNERYECGGSISG